MGDAASQGAVPEVPGRGGLTGAPQGEVWGDPAAGRGPSGGAGHAAGALPRAAFPALRLRRLRGSAGMRALVRETALAADQFVYPLFVVPGTGLRRPIASLPGQFHLSPDAAAAEASAAAGEGVRCFLLFGQPPAGRKDAQGSGAWDPEGAVQLALRAIRAAVPGALLLSDVCLCAYTSHGHCGVLAAPGVPGAARDAGPVVDNDATLPLLARVAVSHAKAGADVVAPSDMMDGRVAAIRAALDAAGHAGVAVLSYAAKFASGFYGPFRDAEDSAPAEGDRHGYQLDPANRRQALREVDLDLAEGADMVMVKPALPYLDVVAAVRAGTGAPLLAYNVSGEYAMVRAAEAAGWASGPELALEVLLAIRRAGADAIITYHAREVARLLRAGG